MLTYVCMMAVGAKMEKEHISVKNMWQDYLASKGEDIDSTDKKYTSWYFSDNEKSADGLAELVLNGTKRGTTGLYEVYKMGIEEFPAVGCYSVITNWNGIAQCIIKTKKITVIPFMDVNDELANIEGEVISL